MDLTSDLICIQGILSRLMKNTGEFTRINYKGGNEDVILNIMLEIQAFLKNKKYITDNNKPNELYDKQLEEVVLFLALNTSYKHPLDMEEYSHLINVTEPLSKCLFSNIVYGLDLCKYYCTVIEKLPISNSAELLDEVLQCLKKSTPDVMLEHTEMFLTTTVNKLSKTTFTQKNEEHIDNICEITKIILLNLSGIYADQIQNWKKDQIYNHMGLCLLALFKLLLQCDQNCLVLRQFIVNVIQTCCSIIKNVTIDVFCAWAETEVEDEVLQTVVSNKAYLVLEKFQKFPEAKELISVLGSIARKPKTLTEQIHEADVQKIIKKVNKKDANQKNWFKALIRTQIFNNPESRECVRKWSHLCDDEDISILLNWCVDKNDEESVEVIIKCISHIDLEKLTIVITKHFYKNKIVNLGSTDTTKPLIDLLNKVKECSGVEELAKNILILFLQKPTDVLTQLYEECLKNGFYANILKVTFKSLKEVIKINNMGVTLLFTVASNTPPNAQNVDKYKGLFAVLIEINYFNSEDVLLKILTPMVNKYVTESNLEKLDLVLQMFLGETLLLPIVDHTKDITKLLLTIMNENRCHFLNFNGLKQQITKHVVDICLDVCKPSYDSEVDISVSDEDNFTQYYKLYLTSGGKELSLFKTICSNFDIDDYGNCVNTMLKLLPPAVCREWLLMSQDIIEKCGTNKCIELFTDVMILLSQLVETQDISNNQSIYFALKNCVRNYGIVVQQKILHNSTLELEVDVNNQICRLLAKLPDSLKQEEGLSLIKILTDRSLKHLANNKEFLCRLILIKNSRLCQVLAQKITGK